MKIINHNTVSLLFERADALGQEPHESWRCIYFKCPYKKEHHNKGLYENFIVNPVINLLADISGYIYLVDDGDIFILFQGALKPVTSKLSAHFGDLDPDRVTGDPETGLFSIFDLSKHWDEFFNLCETKYHHTLISEEPRMHFHHHHGRGITSSSV